MVVTTEDLVGPWASTRSTNGMVQKWSMTDAGSSSAATNRSMSPTVSRIRRKRSRVVDPAHLRQCGEPRDQILGDIQSDRQRHAPPDFLHLADRAGQVAFAGLAPAFQVAQLFVVQRV